MPSQSPLAHDESLMGYVLRMANANEVRGIHWLYQRLGREKLNRFKFEDCLAIACTFGVPLKHIQQTMWRRRFINGAPVNTLGAIKITKPYLIRPLRPQICSRCLEEYGHCRLAWDLQFVCACDIHNCALIDRCPHCLRYLQWMRPFLMHCNCGLSWNRIKPEGQSPKTATARLASIFQYKISPNISNFIPVDSFEKTLAALSVDALSKLVWIFGLKEHANNHLGTGRSQQILRTEQASFCVERGYLRLKAFSCALITSEKGIAFDLINLPALKAFLQDADTAPDVQFAEWLGRETTRQSGGRYNLMSAGPRQRYLF